MDIEEQKYNSAIYRALAGADTYADVWLTFDQLDRAVARELPEYKPEVRRSMIRGELGRMLRSGQIVRDKYTAKYKMSNDVNLF